MWSVAYNQSRGWMLLLLMEEVGGFPLIPRDFTIYLFVSSNLIADLIRLRV